MLEFDGVSRQSKWRALAKLEELGLITIERRRRKSPLVKVLQHAATTTEADSLASLKAERASVAAKGRQVETEPAPVRYVAELVGADTDSERAIRCLIALMVLCCDPLTGAASAQRLTTLMRAVAVPVPTRCQSH